MTIRKFGMLKVGPKVTNSLGNRSAADLVRIAEAKEVLIPIRIDLDTETHRIRDCFTWNLNG